MVAIKTLVVFNIMLEMVITVNDFLKVRKLSFDLNNPDDQLSGGGMMT